MTGTVKEEFLLYGGDVVLEFNPKTHGYFVREGDEPSFRVPSVTGVVSLLDKSGPLLGWATKSAVEVCKGAILPDTEYSETYLEAVWEAAKRAHKDKKQTAADVGTQAHNLIHQRLISASTSLDSIWLVSEAMGNNSDQPETVSNCLRAAGEWLQSHHVEVIHLERPIYSRTHRYSGRCDLVARVDGRLSLVDWKSSKSLHPEYCFQTAAYVNALQEELGELFQDRWLIKLGKEDGSFQDVKLPPETLENDWQAFLALLTLRRCLTETEAALRQTNTGRPDDAGSNTPQAPRNVCHRSGRRSVCPDSGRSRKPSGERRKRSD